MINNKYFIFMYAKNKIKAEGQVAKSIFVFGLIYKMFSIVGTTSHIGKRCEQ
jgi:hypothetical protein